jgi:hypothetical protein
VEEALDVGRDARRRGGAGGGGRGAHRWWATRGVAGSGAHWRGRRGAKEAGARCQVVRCQAA